MSKAIEQLLKEQNELMLCVIRKQNTQQQALERIARALLLHINAGSMKKSEVDTILYGEQQNANS